MNRDEIIRMAREAGFESNSLGVTYTSGWLPDLLERFAALVEAAYVERTKWDGIHSCHDQCQRPFCAAVRKAVAVEREACAEVCAKIVEIAEQDLISEEGGSQTAMLRGVVSGADECFDAIRARGQE